MPNTPYENFVLQNEIEDQFNSYLDMDLFCEVDKSLELKDGMKVTINRYSATNGTQKVAEGQGNTETITAGFTPVTYNIICAQNRFTYTDEQYMKDPLVVRTGTAHMGTDMFNTTNEDTYTEFAKATLVVPVSTFDFAAFVDGGSMFNGEQLKGLSKFAFVHPDDVASIRKNCKDDLKYVTEYVREGYVGTLGDVNLYTKNDAIKGTVIVATKRAVKKFVKTGVTSEAERDANTRTNTLFFRKYYVVALHNEAYAVKMIAGANPNLTTDETVVDGKTYYEKQGMGYHAVKPATGDNPQSKGWYEIVIPDEVRKSAEDRAKVVAAKEAKQKEEAEKAAKKDFNK